MDLMQNLNQWQSLPVMDLPLIYNPKIKSIIFSYFISAHTVQLKGKEERFIFYHFQENMILSLPVDSDKHDCY